MMLHCLQYHVTSLLCGIKNTKEVNRPNRNKLIDAENKLMVTRWEMDKKDEKD